MVPWAVPRNAWIFISGIRSVQVHCAVNLILTAFTVVAVTFAASNYSNCPEKQRFHYMVIAEVPFLIAAAASSLWLTKIAVTDHVVSAARLACINWTYLAMAVQARPLLACPQSPYPKWPESWPPYFYFVFPPSTCMIVATWLMGVYIMTQRLRTLEKMSLESFGTPWLKRLLPVYAVAIYTRIFCVYAEQSGTAMWVLNLTSDILLLALFILLVLNQMKAVRLVRAAAEKSLGGDERRTARLLKVEVFLSLGAMLTSVMSGLLWSAEANTYGEFPAEILVSSWFYPMERSITVFDMVFTLLFAVMMSGAFFMRGVEQRATVEQQRQQRWRRSARSWQARKHDEAQVQWDAKVQALAGRGMTVEALLRFYRKLPEQMPHFRSELHLTKDVVRAAIIPLSAKGQCAYSEIAMGGAYTRPHKMVTHNWSNLFRDLIAAILADALSESDFAKIADLLTKDISILDQWVERMGVKTQVYWVCAFAVNQHVGICGTATVDSVTEQPCAACTCKCPKAWNNTEPLLPDGRSIPCEMNKFDDMMRFLCSTDPSFAQVVAIDAGFMLFTRAWCIAEIATGNQSGMRQALKIHSSESFNKHKDGLRGLKIKDMNASRPEDKAQILASIDDLDAFDQTVQRLLFEDLFPAWNSMDTQEQLSRVGSTIRWHRLGAVP